MTRNQQVIVAISIFISGGFLVIAFQNLHLAEVVDIISSLNIAWLIVGALWYFVAVGVITLRWQFLLNSVQHISLPRLMPLVMIGYMGNNVYPFRSGEALRIFLLWRNHRVQPVQATTTVLIERVFDGIVMLTFIILPLLAIDVQSNLIRQVAIFAAPLFIVALSVFLGLAARPDALRWLVQQLYKLLPERLATLLNGVSEGIIDGLEGLRSPIQLAGAVISSYTTWAIEASVYWIVSFAFDFEISYSVALLVVGTVNLAGLIPASPGQLGVFEFFTSTVLIAIGIPEVSALSYALIVHVVIWLPVTLVGFYFLIRQGLNWSAITRAHEAV